jgi:DICT domain-containing protein
LKDFSPFEQALALLSLPKTELGGLANLSRRDFDERETFFFRALSPSIEYALLLIENTLLLRTNRAARIYAGFERLSCMQPVIDRYLRIADTSGCVYVFGEADWQPPRHPNMRVIALHADSRMARETFLIADSRNFHAALIAHDEDGLKNTRPDERNFIAFKSTSSVLVPQLALAMEGLIDWSFAA